MNLGFPIATIVHRGAARLADAVRSCDLGFAIAFRTHFPGMRGGLYRFVALGAVSYCLYAIGMSIRDPETMAEGGLANEATLGLFHNGVNLICAGIIIQVAARIVLHYSRTEIRRAVRASAAALASIMEFVGLLGLALARSAGAFAIRPESFHSPPVRPPGGKTDLYAPLC